MTFAQLVAEVIARGFDYVATNRIETFVQRNHQRLEGRYVWPWREASKEGVAPFEIKDLRDVLSVANTTSEYPLYGQTRQWLTERWTDLEETGQPTWWWLDDQTLRVFPTSTTENISVRYASKPAALAEAAEPDMPSEWHGLIVDLSVVECLKDNDEFKEARELRESVGVEVQEMAAAELKRDLQSPRLTIRTGYAWDYL